MNNNNIASARTNLLSSDKSPQLGQISSARTNLLSSDKSPQLGQISSARTNLLSSDKSPQLGQISSARTNLLSSDKSPQLGGSSSRSEVTINGWRYYNHAAMPATNPHELPDLTPIHDHTIWNLRHNGHTPLMAMWTSDYDCRHESDFWYVVKDSPFDISQLNSNRRYKITKGNRYFLVREFDPAEFGEQIYSILVETLKTYKGIKASVDREEILCAVKYWQSSYYKVYGAFFRENGELAGYTLLRKNDNCISIPVYKTHPQYEKYQASAALLNKMLQDHADFLASGGYICDGSRNIQHKTNFHDYLAKYFQFRRAYCRLHIIYHPRIRLFVKMLYPFRKILRRLDGIRLIHNINGVLLMEEISRSS